MTAAAGQYNAGLFIKSANQSKYRTQVTVNITVSCSPSRSILVMASVVQGTSSAYTLPADAVNVTCDTGKTSFSVTALTANAPPPGSGPLSKGPALSLSMAAQRTSSPASS